MRATGWTYQQYQEQPKPILQAMAIDAEAEQVAQQMAAEDSK